MNRNLSGGKRKRNGNGSAKRRRVTPKKTVVFVPYGSGEVKFHDVDHDDAAIATGGTVIPTVAIIAQGVGESERIGRKITVSKIHWRYDLELATSTNINDSDIVRVIMFQDKQCNKATAAVLDILETADFQSFRNLSNVGRFNILLDRSFNLNFLAGAGNGTSNDGATVVRGYTFYKNCSIPMEYNAGTGGITEITSNNIGTLLISKRGNGIMTSKIRLRFTDGS